MSRLSIARKQIVKGTELSPEILGIWARFVASNPALASPFFTSSFVRIVASSCSDIEVALVESERKIAAIFPYHRRRFDIAGPVGAFLSDYHGLVSESDFSLHPPDLLRACGLVAWDFSHLPTDQRSFIQFHRKVHRSPIIDLSAGYELYVRSRRDAGTEQIRKNGNLMRRLEREVGPLRFVTHSSDKALLEQVIAWKTAQFRRNRWRDLFSIPWVRQTIEYIHATQTHEFAGILSALYAGDRLVAAHFGMRSASVWHYWFPTYDPAYAKYSVGVMLLLRIAEAAPALGIQTIDLGCGEHSYKSRLMNGSVSTANGSVELPCATTLARRMWTPVRILPFKLRSVLSKTPIGSVARRIRNSAVQRRVYSQQTTL
jgi:CelD/BcsL family acetyltransferase involved in cellulose biosynthesis